MPDSKTTDISMAETEALIAAHPFFSELSPKEVKELARLAKTYRFNSNEVIVKENDYIDRIYLIAEGKAEVSQETVVQGVTINRPLILLHQGEAIGLSEEGLYARGQQRTATVTALTPMVLLGINLSELNSFLRTMT